MGRDNNNAGVHFVHYLHTESDADALRYLNRKKYKKKQEIERKQFDELEKYDKECCLSIEDADEIPVVNYDDNDCNNLSMYFYNCVRVKKGKKCKLTIWVGYDIGGENYRTGEKEPRGYYLYLSHHFSNDKSNRKLLLLKVNRKSHSSLERALRIAKLYAKKIVENYYPSLEVDWNNPVYERYASAKFAWITDVRIRQFRTINNCMIFE